MPKSRRNRPTRNQLKKQRRSLLRKALAKEREAFNELLSGAVRAARGPGAARLPDDFGLVQSPLIVGP